MKKLTTLASVIAIALSASAFAAHNNKIIEEVKTDIVADADVVPQDFYATLGVGYGNFSNKVSGLGTFQKNKPTYMIGFGKQFNNRVRADITLDINSKVAKTKAPNSLEHKFWTVRANAYYHFDDIASVSPYVTAGLGYSRQKFILTTPSFTYRINRYDLSSQVGFGISTKISDKMTLDLGYRRVKPGNNTTFFFFPFVKSITPTVHKIMATIRIPL
jgi:opacity protein-like surface antigen